MGLTRSQALSHLQRFDTYIVISMPKRRSTATGVSHFMSRVLLFNAGSILRRCPRRPTREDHESGVMNFWSRCCATILPT